MFNRDHRFIEPEAAPTLAALFRERVARTPQAEAYRQFDERARQWQGFSWQEVAERVARWQSALRGERLARGERVAIMCRNSVDWVVCDQAAQGLGLVLVPIYTNDRAENVGWILNDSGAGILVVESLEQWDGLSEVGEQLGALQRVVVLQPEVDSNDPRVVAIDGWLAAGYDSGEPAGEERAPDEPATIVYTSGTTGRPKGVMLSHHNIVWNLYACLALFDVRPDDRLLSFLPLSHTFERTAGYYLPMAAGASIAYNRSIGQLAEDLETLKPTVMISVPRIFERVYGRITGKLATESALKRRLFRTAVDLGWRRYQNRQGNGPSSAGFVLHPLLDALVGRKVRDKLGGRLRFTVCGGAALSPDVARLFIGLGIPVVQGYGLTETSPVIAANTLDDNRPETVGRPIPGVEIRIGANDELLTRSPSVMLGYWQNPKASARIIDADGWLHTGDRVRLDDGGRIRITGRLKEIIVLSNGEKVPPIDIENAITLDEMFDQVILVGEGKPYLSALVVPNPDEFEHLARGLHLDPANEETCCDEKVRGLMLERLQQRLDAFPGYAQVHELAVVREPWTPENGLMTPTLKLRRNRILQRYHELTDKLYEGHSIAG